MTFNMPLNVPLNLPLDITLERVLSKSSPYLKKMLILEAKRWSAGTRGQPPAPRPEKPLCERGKR
jgi:hypothetical protein